MITEKQIPVPPYEVEQDTLYTFKPKDSPYSAMQIVVNGLSQGIQLGSAKVQNTAEATTGSVIFPRMNSFNYDTPSLPKRLYPDTGPRDITWTRGMKVVE